eukprot:TRINITY_DN30289_c0_g1_i1.p1 TRINITY_DN30289_c0_g1~~TRINITY_DN30289_c0_g1_i1.p1  ORF type:complete len:272 (-),score=68.04 TRINITY_DN30289_c0_g1_i1:12-827(-)
MMCSNCCVADDETKDVIIGIKAGSAPGVSMTSSDEINELSKDESVESAPVMSEPMATQTCESRESPPVEETKMQEIMIPTAKASDNKAARPRRLVWNVCLEKNKGESVNVDVDYADTKTLKIIRIKDGLLKSWNAENPKSAVRINDRITAVNDVTGGTTELIAEVQASSKVNLTVYRHNTLEILVTKEAPEQAIGLDVDGLSMRVLLVKEGPVMSYNNSLDPELGDFAVNVNDRIVDVNGKQAAAEMIEEMKTHKVLEIALVRPEDFTKVA